LLRGGSVVRDLSREDSFTISRTDSSNDFGIYRCEVEDDDGQLLGAAYSALTIASGAPNNAQIVKFDEKSEAIITCPVYALPGAEVTWEKQDGELPEMAVTSRNKLIIKEFDDAATGTYVCKVSVEGQQIEGFVNALIYAQVPIVEPVSQTVKVNETIQLRCTMPSHPHVMLTWERLDGLLNENATDQNGVLTIEKAQASDQGIYICLTDDFHPGHPMHSAPARVVVETFPDTIIQVLLEASSESVAIGDRAWFDCKVTGDPEAEITWTRDADEELPDNAQVRPIVVF
uniref:Cell adhesion molecule 1b n=1 Tax=Anisakis simplex TaxID=6269 RepID=A0A0M3KCM3_ANISI